MRPVLSEGEPDFTDRYLCDTCQHEDHIPTMGIILGQLATSLFGGAISSYLFATRFKRMLGNIEHSDLSHILGDVILLLLALLFSAGFVFLLKRGVQGFNHRHAYLRPPATHITLSAKK
jgi:hypothetical protein